MLFSQRKGIKSSEKLAQYESIDTDLRNSLWNALVATYFERAKFQYSRRVTGDCNLINLVKMLWIHYFKLPTDQIPYDWDDTLSVLRKYFFDCEWYEVYDFIEYISKAGPTGVKKDLIEICNAFLERENSAYRFVCEEITQITSPEEIESVETASKSKYSAVNHHLTTALGLLNSRNNPDFRNSIKESISAVECLVKILTNDSKATLGQALKKLEESKNLHPAFKASLSSLYGYTNDASGIRHALLDEPTLTKSDAKFMLVTCSAFINYLIENSEHKP
ncbi:hypothetical protein WG219_15495 [Ectopseudomonas mendocina]|uniref:HEPN AbiJ-N-terminal domain-containing protein n=1 Tax=Ectopseudomonas mendocina TaxID=300 RepID=A0ABZ2RCD8_ECTME